MVSGAVVAKFPIWSRLQKAASTESSAWTSGNAPGNWLTSVSNHPRATHMLWQETLCSAVNWSLGTLSLGLFPCKAGEEPCQLPRAFAVN